MNLEKIKSLIEQKESHHLEFKKSTGVFHSAFETLCSFLNSEGGIVFIGVTNDGGIIGQEVTDKIQQAIANEISKLEPPAKISISYIPLENKGRFIIALQAKPGYHKPYVYEGRPFQREQTITKRMPQQHYDQLVSQRLQLNFSWERQIAEGYSIDDLDHNLLWGVARKAVETNRMPEEALRQDVPDLLKALKLLADDVRINNAAVALFGKKVTSAYLQCQLKVARFKGIDRNEFIDGERIHGNIFELLKRGMAFVRQHLPLAAKIEPGKLERVETLLIPFDAVREVLINTLCHKDYSIYGESIGLAIYDDRMEIFNNGGLQTGITLEMIKSGHSDPRNPVIANVFYRANLIEGWGRGIPKVIDSCLAANDPEPEFFANAVEFKVILRFPVSIKPPVIAFKSEEESIAKLTPRQEKIMKILSDGQGKKAKDIMSQIKEPITERTLRRDLMALKVLGIVEMRGLVQTATWFLNQDKK